MEDVCRVDVLQTAQDLVDEGLEVGVGEGLAGADDGGQIALHELCVVLALFGARIAGGIRTFVEVALVEVVWAGDVHIVQTCDLQSCCQYRRRGGECVEAYVAVASEVLQQLDLAQGALGEDLFAEDIGDLLDGDALAGLVVGRGAVDGSISMCILIQYVRAACRCPSLPDNAVGALAQLLCHIVPLVDDELLVEDLEDLAVREVRHGGRRGSSCSCSCCCCSGAGGVVGMLARGGSRAGVPGDCAAGGRAGRDLQALQALQAPAGGGWGDIWAGQL